MFVSNFNSYLLGTLNFLKINIVDVYAYFEHVTPMLMVLNSCLYINCKSTSSRER